MIRKIIAGMLIVLFLFSMSSTIVKSKGSSLPDPKENSPMVKETEWTYDTESDEIYPYLAPNDELYILDSTANKLISLNEKGFTKWEYSFEDDFTGISAFKKNSIYLITENISSGKTSLLKLDSVDGSRLWKDYIEIDDINNLLINDNDEIYLSSYPNKIVKLSDDREEIWSKTLDDDGYSRMLKLDDNGDLYVLSRPYVVYCYNPEGRKLWTIDIESDSKTDEYINSLCTDERDLFLFTNRSIYEIGLDGDLTKKYHVEKGEISIFSIKEEDTFYLDITEKDVHDIKTINENGTVKWAYELQDVSNDFNIMISVGKNDRIYYQFINQSLSGKIDVNKVLCFDKDGSLAWKQEYDEGDIGFHFISKSGMIYFVKGEDTIYAYQGKPASSDKSGGWTMTISLVIAIFIVVLLIMIGNAVWRGTSDRLDDEEENRF